MLVITILIMFFPLLVTQKQRCNKLFFDSFFIKNFLRYNSLTKNTCYNKYYTFNNRKISTKMKGDSPFIAVYVTTPNKDVAENISNVLLKEKLASCVNIIPGIISLYHWKGEIAKDNEVLMMIKTKKHLFQEIVNSVKLNHPYEVPEVIAIPIQHGSEEYLKWVSNSVKPIDNQEGR
ncbi:cutA, putative [Plasmodium gallinaceum]|uniref:CutA, putative n=1 Tax=Plasmodium gallinaceum TaxID=5849 RepID=A0A1J1GX31_PLAGA|nr:cutA, putative [Plasmodium gallinaceum]CRG97123.1 cutA, putative [Plasmodium gallinaceum]